MRICLAIYNDKVIEFVYAILPFNKNLASI